MIHMQHTTNYNLNQWEDGDVVRREDFNADNVAIDAALAAVATTAGKAVRIFAGTYIGDGAASQIFRLGFQPKAVLVIASNGLLNSSGNYYGGMATPGHPVACSSGTILALEDDGFRYYYSSSGPHTNVSGQRYHFAVFF